jgi:predicted nucleic acid-binding protein
MAWATPFRSEEGVPLDGPQGSALRRADDPSDDYPVALALTAKADFLVTRERHFEQVRTPPHDPATPTYG